MREGQNGGNPRLDDSDQGYSERELGDLKDTLRMYRDSVRTAAERPDFFWKRQHNTIMANLKKPVSAGYRPAMLWLPAAVVLFLCLFFFVENSKAPTPDLAAGSDQNLLIDVERALNQDYPDALAPAALLGKEIEQVRKTMNGN